MSTNYTAMDCLDDVDFASTILDSPSTAAVLKASMKGNVKSMIDCDWKNSNVFWLIVTTIVVLTVTILNIDWGDQRTIAVLLIAFPGTSCIGAVETALNEATYPNRVQFFIANAFGAESCLKGYDDLFIGSETISDHIDVISEIFSPDVGMNAVKSKLINEQILSKGLAFDFVLEAHAHTLFGAHWDERTISEWTAVGDTRSLLTTHPSASRTMADREFGHNEGYLMNVLCSTKFKPPYQGSDLPIIAYDHPMEIKPPKRRRDHRGRVHFVPIEVPFWSSYLSFGPFEYLLEVPYDPSLKGLEEEDGPELLYAARLRTHGFRFYAPTQDLVYHNYHQHIWEREHTIKRYNLQCKQDQDRIWSLLINGDGGDHYGFGTDMTVDHWLRIVGIDLKQRKMQNLCRSVKDRKWNSKK